MVKLVKSFVDCTLAHRHMYVDNRTLYISQQRFETGDVHLNPCSLSGCCDSTLPRVTQQASTPARASITPVANEQRWQVRQILLLLGIIEAIEQDISYVVIARDCKAAH